MTLTGTSMSICRISSLLGVAALCVVATSGCSKKSIPARVTAEVVALEAKTVQDEADADKASMLAALKGGELFFEERFQSNAIPTKAQIERLKDEAAPAIWRIESGWLRNDDAKNQGLWLKALPEGDGPVRIEFRARSVNPPKKRAFPGDIKIEAFATTPNHEAGYSLINGGWSNQFDTIARLGEHTADARRSPAKPVAEGIIYQYAILRRGGRIDWIRDGELLYTFVDAEPVHGQWIGFNNWLSDVSFTDLKVFRLP